MYNSDQSAKRTHTHRQVQFVFTQGYEGIIPGGFYMQLIKAALHADAKNLHAIGQAFPYVVEALLACREGRINELLKPNSSTSADFVYYMPLNGRQIHCYGALARTSNLQIETTDENKSGNDQGSTIDALTDQGIAINWYTVAHHLSLWGINRAAQGGWPEQVEAV